MLQKVLLCCVLAGPGEPKSAPRLGQAFPRAFGSGGARSPIHDSARLAGQPHPGRMIRCRMRTITLRGRKNGDGGVLEGIGGSCSLTRFGPAER